MVFADQCWYKSMAPLMESVREQMGARPVYFTFDIDGIDPTACPGTGKYDIPNLTQLRCRCVCSLAIHQLCTLAYAAAEEAGNFL